MALNQPLSAPSTHVTLAIALYVLWLTGAGVVHLVGWYQPASTGRRRAGLLGLQAALNASCAYGLCDATLLGWTTLGDRWRLLCYAGAAAVAGGLALRLAARATLRQNFSAYVQSAGGHALVTRGVYRFARHPAYTGFIAMLVGFPICLGSLGGLVIAIALGTPAILLRIEREEAALAGWFGDEYRAYQERTARLLPGIW